MRYYFDTSSLVKIYHKEIGTSKFLEIYKNPENLIQISESGCIEFLSKIHRKYREKKITSDILDILINKFQEDTDSRYEILQFSSLIMYEATILIQNTAKEFSLKTLDSLQLPFLRSIVKKILSDAQR
jgi:uncharacterized protein